MLNIYKKTYVEQKKQRNWLFHLVMRSVFLWSVMKCCGMRCYDLFLSELIKIFLKCADSPVVVNGQPVKRRRNVATTDCRQSIVVKVNSLEGFESFESSWLDIWNVTFRQVKFRQVLESVEGPSANCLDRIAAKRKAHESGRLTV